MSRANKQQGLGIIKVIALTPLVLIGLVMLAFIFTLLNKSYWDYRVKQMCEKDGGVTVYEKVELSEEEYKKYGGRAEPIRVPLEDSSSTNFFYVKKWLVHTLHKTNPEVIKSEFVVYRKYDGKKFGKMITYTRSGGDFPTIIGHPSGFSCRDIPGFKLNLEQQIFSVKEN